MPLEGLHPTDGTLTFELGAQDGLEVAWVDRVNAPRAEDGLLESYPRPLDEGHEEGEDAAFTVGRESFCEKIECQRPFEGQFQWLTTVARYYQGFLLEFRLLAENRDVGTHINRPWHTPIFFLAVFA